MNMKNQKISTKIEKISENNFASTQVIESKDLDK